MLKTAAYLAFLMAGLSAAAAVFLRRMERGPGRAGRGRIMHRPARRRTEEAGQPMRGRVMRGEETELLVRSARKREKVRSKRRWEKGRGGPLLLAVVAGLILFWAAGLMEGVGDLVPAEAMEVTASSSGKEAGRMPEDLSEEDRVRSLSEGEISEEDDGPGAVRAGGEVSLAGGGRDVDGRIWGREDEGLTYRAAEGFRISREDTASAWDTAGRDLVFWEPCDYGDCWVYIRKDPLSSADAGALPGTAGEGEADGGSVYPVRLSFGIDGRAPEITRFSVEKLERSPAVRALHFLSFGLIAGEDSLICVRAREEGPSSGVDRICLFRDGEAYGRALEASWDEEKGDFYAVFRVRSEDFRDLHRLGARAWDKAGNESDQITPMDEETSFMEAGSAGFQIDREAPRVSISLREEAVSQGDRSWSGKDVVWELDIADRHAGIRSVELTLCGRPVRTSFDQRPDVQTDSRGRCFFLDERTDHLTCEIESRMADGWAGEEGSCRLCCRVVDHAGNETAEEAEIFLDKQSPEVESFVFLGTDAGPESRSLDGAEASYQIFCRNELTVRVRAEDRGPSAGIEEIRLYTLDERGRRRDFAPALEGGGLTRETDEIWTADFLIPGNFKGRAYASVADRTGHRSVREAVSPGLVVETAERAEEELVLEADLMEEAESVDAEGNPLYAEGDVPVGIRLWSGFAGLQKARVRVRWEAGRAMESWEDLVEIPPADCDPGPALLSQGGIKWRIEDREEGLITGLSGVILLNSESRGILVEVEGWDGTGYHRVSEPLVCSIDRTAPSVSVEFDNNQPDEEGFYGEERSALVEVRDANFDPARAELLVMRDGSPVETDGAWTKSGGSLTGSYQRRIFFREDGEYRFSVRVTDRAGHEADGVDLAAGTRDGDHFVVDRTDPEVELALDWTDVRNIFFFRSPREVRVLVREKNFDPARLALSVKRVEGGEVPGAGDLVWEKAGDSHIGRLRIREDGDYRLAVSVVDRAGNRSAWKWDSGEESVHFILDQTLEDAELVWGEKPAGSGEGGGQGRDMPGIRIRDPYFSYGRLRLFRTDWEGRQTDVTDRCLGEPVLTETGLMLEARDFGSLREYDGRYLLKMDYGDLAGNSCRREIAFTVDRFGSVFRYGDYLTSILDRNLRSVERDLEIREYNPAGPGGDKTRVEILRDGLALPQAETAGVWRQQGEMGWHRRDYLLKKENFRRDGIYQILISSSDQAGNYSETGVGSCPIRFVVDRTAPELAGLLGLESKVIRAGKREVSFRIFDAMGLAAVEVYADGRQVLKADGLEAGTSYEGVFCLEEGRHKGIRILARDLAGNVLDTDRDQEKGRGKTAGGIRFEREILVSGHAPAVFFAGMEGPLRGLILFFLVPAGLVALFAGRRIREKRRKNRKL